MSKIWKYVCYPSTDGFYGFRNDREQYSLHFCNYESKIGSPSFLKTDRFASRSSTYLPVLTIIYRHFRRNITFPPAYPPDWLIRNVSGERAEQGSESRSHQRRGNGRNRAEQTEVGQRGRSGCLNDWVTPWKSKVKRTLRQAVHIFRKCGPMKTQPE